VEQQAFRGQRSVNERSKFNEAIRAAGLEFWRTLSEQDRKHLTLYHGDNPPNGTIEAWFAVENVPGGNGESWHAEFSKADFAERLARVPSMENMELAEFIRAYPNEETPKAEALARLLTK